MYCTVSGDAPKLVHRSKIKSVSRQYMMHFFGQAPRLPFVFVLHIWVTVFWRRVIHALVCFISNLWRWCWRGNWTFWIIVPKIPGVGLHFFGSVSQQMNQLVTVQLSKNNVRWRSVTVNLLKCAIVVLFSSLFQSKLNFSFQIFCCYLL